MKWGNVRVKSITTDAETGKIHIVAEDLPNDKDYKGTKKMNWVS